MFRKGFVSLLEVVALFLLVATSASAQQPVGFCGELRITSLVRSFIKEPCNKPRPERVVGEHRDCFVGTRRFGSRPGRPTRRATQCAFSGRLVNTWRQGRPISQNPVSGQLPYCRQFVSQEAVWLRIRSSAR
jgi:hypothetical protein